MRDRAGRADQVIPPRSGVRQDRFQAGGHGGEDDEIHGCAAPGPPHHRQRSPQTVVGALGERQGEAHECDGVHDAEDRSPIGERDAPGVRRKHARMLDEVAGEHERRISDRLRDQPAGLRPADAIGLPADGAPPGGPAHRQHDPERQQAEDDPLGARHVSVPAGRPAVRPVMARSGGAPIVRR